MQERQLCSTIGRLPRTCGRRSGRRRGPRRGDCASRTPLATPMLLSSSATCRHAAGKRAAPLSSWTTSGLRTSLPPMSTDRHVRPQAVITPDREQRMVHAVRCTRARGCRCRRLAASWRWTKTRSSRSCAPSCQTACAAPCFALLRIRAAVPRTIARLPLTYPLFCARRVRTRPSHRRHMDAVWA